MTPPMASRRYMGLMRDVIWTFFAQTGVSLLGLALIRITAAAVGAAEFGAFLVTRRVIALGLPAVTANTGAAISREIGRAPAHASEIGGGAAALVLVVGAVVMAVATIASAPLAAWIFDDARLAPLVPASAAALVGVALIQVASDYERGRQDIRRSNLLQLAGNVLQLLPAAALWALSIGGFEYVQFQSYLSGALMACLAVPVIGPLLPHARAAVRSGALRRTVRFGMMRLAGPLLAMVHLALPVFVAAQVSLEAATVVGVAVSLARLSEGFAYPFNYVFIPRFAAAARDGGDRWKREAALVLGAAAAVLPVLACLQWGTTWIAVWLAAGSDYVPVAGDMEWALVLSWLALAHILVRGILDAVFEFPYGNLSSGAGLATSAAVIVALPSTPLNLSLAFGLGVAVMGAVSWSVLAVRVLGASSAVRQAAAAIAPCLVVVPLCLGLDGLISAWAPLPRGAAQLTGRLVLLALVYRVAWRRQPWVLVTRSHAPIPEAT